jgi:hypothetical protein
MAFLYMPPTHSYWGSLIDLFFISYPSCHLMYGLDKISIHVTLYYLRSLLIWVYYLFASLRAHIGYRYLSICSLLRNIVVLLHTEYMSIYSLLRNNCACCILSISICSLLQFTLQNHSFYSTAGESETCPIILLCHSFNNHRGYG